jgi:hypothetical protein
MSSPVLRNETWQSLSPSSSLMPTFEQVIRKLGGRVQEGNETSLEATFGSHIRYRLLGAYIPGGQRRAPLSLHLRLEPLRNSNSRVSLTCEDASGWYAVRIQAHNRTLERRCDEIVAALRSAG